MVSNFNNDSEIKSRLQDLVVHNPELERLESILDRFNIFEALGAIRQEIRHSDFLAFLLNPRQNHGLGDLFVKRLLQEALAQANSIQPVTPIDLDIWVMDDIEVRREWQSIDVLILDGLHQLAVIIENKIYSGEHDDQVKRYYQFIKQHYPGYQILGLYLTPEGEDAGDSNYIAISYGLICKLIENIIQTREPTLGRDVMVLMGHYAEMLRRYIVGESEIEKLCQQIYRKHQSALDLIYEYRPDQQAEIKDFLCELIRSNPQMVLDHSSKAAVYFIPMGWDDSILHKGQGWTRSGRMLLFQFNNYQDSLKLSLVVGPGPDEIRHKIYEVTSQHEPPFKHSFKIMGRLWSTVFNRNFLSKNNYQEKTTEELQEEIKHRWNEFLDHDLPKMDDILVKAIEQIGNPVS